MRPAKHYVKARINEIVLYSFSLLIIAHGTYNTWIPDFFVNFFFFAIIVFLFVHIYVKKPLIVFILTVYFCSHFEFMVHYGGLFVTAPACAIILIRLSQTKSRIGNKPKLDLFAKSLLFIFIAANLAGLIFKNPLGMSHKAIGLLSFSGYIMLFVLTSKQSISRNDLSVIIRTFYLLIIYQFATSLNTRMGIIKTQTPLLKTAEGRFDTIIAGGTFEHSELLGEYSLAMVLFFTVILTSGSIYVNKKEKFILFTGIVISLFNLFLSASRSTFFLLFVGILLIYIIGWIYKTTQASKTIKYTAVLLIIASLTGSAFNLRFLLNRFSDDRLAAQFESDPKNINWITGEGTPRQLAFRYFWTRYDEDNWHLGYGWSTQESNRTAWFGDPDTPRADYHSLYFSIIMIYGWIGSLAFISLVLYLLFQCLKAVKRKHSLTVVAMGFFVMLLMVMINEYKISMLRITTYHMIFWIWLGMAVAVSQNVLAGEQK